MIVARLAAASPRPASRRPGGSLGHAGTARHRGSGDRQRMPVLGCRRAAADVPDSAAAGPWPAPPDGSLATMVAAMADALPAGHMAILARRPTLVDACQAVGVQLMLKLRAAEAAVDAPLRPSRRLHPGLRGPALRRGRGDRRRRQGARLRPQAQQAGGASTAPGAATSARTGSAAPARRRNSFTTAASSIAGPTRGVPKPSGRERG